MKGSDVTNKLTVAEHSDNLLTGDEYINKCEECKKVLIDSLKAIEGVKRKILKVVK